MEWLTAIKKSIDFMEAHLLDDISADDVAVERKKRLTKIALGTKHFFFYIVYVILF